MSAEELKIEIQNLTAPQLLSIVSDDSEENLALLPVSTKRKIDAVDFNISEIDDSEIKKEMIKTTLAQLFEARPSFISYIKGKLTSLIKGKQNIGDSKVQSFLSGLSKEDLQDIKDFTSEFKVKKARSIRVLKKGRSLRKKRVSKLGFSI